MGIDVHDLIRSLPQQETSLNWSDFTCIEIVKCYYIIPLETTVDEKYTRHV